MVRASTLSHHPHIGQKETQVHRITATGWRVSRSSRTGSRLWTRLRGVGGRQRAGDVPRGVYTAHLCNSCGRRGEREDLHKGRKALKIVRVVGEHPRHPGDEHGRHNIGIMNAAAARGNGRE